MEKIIHAWGLDSTINVLSVQEVKAHFSTFLFLLATFCFGVVKGKAFEVMLVLGAYSVYSAIMLTLLE